ncbi:MAG: helix-turn-helix domain-containing protein [Chromatiaceae bacterium]|nr:helix-turn-helix domain-containing protein [Candidatus Thioaporhodococcus sediminis]
MKYVDFASRLKLACREGRLPENHAALARLFRVSQPMVSYYMNGAKLPSMDKAIHIAIVCGVCVEWLLTGRGPKNPRCGSDNGDWLDLRGLDQSVRLALRAAVNASSPPPPNKSS